MRAETKSETRFTVRNYETDINRELKPSFMLGYFQEAATAHSDKMGMGYDVLHRDGRFWVLSKICVQILRRPVFGEALCAVTWPHAPNRATYERSFVLEDAEGNNCVRALSRWCILDRGGHIVPTSQVAHAEMEFTEGRALENCDWKISEAQSSPQPAFSVRIANSECDLNGHVSNIKYADYVFNCFSVAELQKQRLGEFALHYVRQAYDGDCLDFYREDREDGYLLVTGRRGEETVVAARVRLEEGAR